MAASAKLHGCVVQRLHHIFWKTLEEKAGAPANKDVENDALKTSVLEWGWRILLPCPLLWPPASYAGRRPFCFTAGVYFFVFQRLISEVAWPIVTNFATRSTVTQIFKIGQKFERSHRPEILTAQKYQNSARFRTTSRLDREYLRNATRHRQSKNGIANLGRSRTSVLNSVYFGPQTAKIGPELRASQRAAITLDIATHLVGSGKRLLGSQTSERF